MNETSLLNRNTSVSSTPMADWKLTQMTHQEHSELVSLLRQINQLGQDAENTQHICSDSITILNRLVVQFQNAFLAVELSQGLNNSVWEKSLACKQLCADRIDRLRCHLIRKNALCATLSESTRMIVDVLSDMALCGAILDPIDVPSSPVSGSIDVQVASLMARTAILAIQKPSSFKSAMSIVMDIRGVQLQLSSQIACIYMATKTLLQHAAMYDRILKVATSDYGNDHQLIAALDQLEAASNVVESSLLKILTRQPGIPEQSVVS